jgi:hypothetical protein
MLPSAWAVTKGSKRTENDQFVKKMAVISLIFTKNLSFICSRYNTTVIDGVP